MESFENFDREEAPENTPEEAEEFVPEEAQEAPRKASPYADSPYVMNSMPQFEGKAKPPRKKPSALGKGIVAVLLAVALVAGSCAVTAAVVNEVWEERTEASLAKMRREMEQMQTQVNAASNAASAALPKQGSDMTPAQLYASNVDSVVAISIASQANAYYGTSQASVIGSGFIIREDGYIITNNHVVEDATSIMVTVNNGDEYDATLVGKDATNDLAVLKVEATGLKAAALGSSNDLIIGDMVVAIGNPLGKLNATQTVGYVSGINREVSTGSLTTISMIQTDAAINPGNSGGPLFNMYGQVIGITTAKYSGTTGSGASIEGIGFAIPIDDVIPLIDDIIDYGYVTGAYMGITARDTDATAAQEFGITGAYVVSVESDGAAHRAGIKPGDIIIGLDDAEITNFSDLSRGLRKYKAGDTAQVTVLRSGKEITLTIELDEKPQETQAAQPLPQESSDNQIPDGFGDIFDFFRYFW